MNGRDTQGKIKFRVKLFKNRQMESLVEYLLVFFLIINIMSMWVRYGWGYSHMYILRMATPLLAVACGFIKMYIKRNFCISKRFLIHFIFLLVCIMMSAVNDVSTIGNALIQIFIPIVSFLFLSYTLDYSEIESLLMKYVNFMFIIAIVSLVFYFWGSIFNVVRSTGTIEYEWGNIKKATTYYGLYYAPEIQIADSFILGLQKNCGIFTEGTMYGYMLNLAYMFLRRNLENHTRMKVVFFFTILSTLSVMPILSLLIFEGIIFVKKSFKNRFLSYIKVLFLPLGMSLGIAIFVKVIASKMITGSYNVRSDHMVGCLKVFLDTFPFGAGYGNRDALFNHFKYEQGLSVGIPYFIALGGVEPCS